MVAGLLNLIFGSKNDREINQLRPLVTAINALEPSTSALSDTALADKSAEFRKRIENGENLDDLLPEAFAVCREMSKRVLVHAPLRRAAHGRHDPPQGPHRRNEDR